MESGRRGAAGGPGLEPGPNPPSHFSCFRVEDLVKAKKIGSGGFGDVYRAYHQVWRVPLAVKYLKSETSNSHELLEEAKKMHKAQFEYILRLYGIIKCDLSTQTESLGLVTEFMENGSLKELLSCYKVPWPLHLRFAYEIALGMNFLHNLKPALYHHDLSPANILLNKDYRIKISDFGLAKWRKLTSQNSNDSSKIHGTLSYMPPECFNDISARKDSKFDVYSYGIVIWEILTCQVPYKTWRNYHSIWPDSNLAGNPVLKIFECQMHIKSTATLTDAVNSEHIMSCVGRGNRPNMKEIPNELEKPCGKLIKLMQQCWHDNPNDRPPFSKCVYELEPQKICEQKIQQAVQELTQQLQRSRAHSVELPQISSCVDGLCEMNIGGHVRDSSDLCVPVEEQNKCTHYVESILESAWKERTPDESWKECTPEVNQGGRQEEILKSPSSTVTSNECQELAELVNKDWKSLGRYLGLTDGQIEIIQYDNQAYGLTETVYQMLCTWTQHQGLNASRAVLAQGLTQIGKEGLWKKLWR
ncbi:receptor-interacting serine/threonine-protein kinase 4-like [Narcine bancroftii]|uniref:receptor-interacting serine/threonine-protein kinase 4-like n=1 Tax=Narcine bancroftii TaxID=1343680 RepID=UPI00383136EB